MLASSWYLGGLLFLFLVPLSLSLSSRLSISLMPKSHSCRFDQRTTATAEPEEPLRTATPHGDPKAKAKCGTRRARPVPPGHLGDPGLRQQPLGAVRALSPPLSGGHGEHGGQPARRTMDLG